MSALKLRIEVQKFRLSAPFVPGQLCDVMDLDGPIFLAQDRTPSMTYRNGGAWSDENVWGGARA